MRPGDVHARAAQPVAPPRPSSAMPSSTDRFVLARLCPSVQEISSRACRDPGGERPLGPAQVRAPGRSTSAAGRRRQPAEQLVGVGHLRHQPRADERAGLHRPDAGGAAAGRTSSSLVVRGHRPRLDLQPVAQRHVRDQRPMRAGPWLTPPSCPAGRRSRRLLSWSRSVSTSAVCSPSSGPSQRTRPGCCAELGHDAREQHLLGRRRRPRPPSSSSMSRARKCGSAAISAAE